MSLSAQEARELLQGHGYEPPPRGNLGRKWRAMAEDIAAGAEPGSPPEGYADGTSEADFTEATAPEPEDTTAAAPGPEQKPRRPKVTKPSTSARVRSVFTRQSGKPKTKAKARHPRLPVDRLIGRVWEGLGRLAQPVSQPLATTLALQAPIAGLILEDTVRGTVVDKALQPVVRAEQRGEKVFALAGPPVLVLALQNAMGIPDPDQRAARVGVLQMMLIEALTMWVKIAGDKTEEARERVAESQDIRDQVEKLLAEIFAPPPQPQEGAPVATQMAGVV